MSESTFISVLEDTGRQGEPVSDRAATESQVTHATGQSSLFTGACFCKAITFTLSSLPDKSYICHCLDCRHITGTSFAHNIMFPFSSLVISTGVAGETSHAPSMSPDVDSVLSTFGNVEKGRIQFCKHCGSRLFLFPPAGAEGKVDFVLVTVGSIDESHEDERLKPTNEGFCKRREGWMPDMRGTKVFEAW